MNEAMNLLCQGSYSQGYAKYKDFSRTSLKHFDNFQVLKFYKNTDLN